MMRRARSVVVALSVLALLPACAGTGQPAPPPTVVASPLAPVRAELFGPRLPTPDAKALIELSPDQQADFLAFFDSDAQSIHKPHERIYRYVEGRLGDFRYHGSTLTASEALAQNHGNCLSLAVVTTALAQLVGVPADYRLVRNAPIYERRHGLVTVADHVQTRLYDPTFVPEPGVYGAQPSFIVIDYFPERGQRRGGRVDLSGLLAMFYVNLAGEALVARDLPSSYWLLQSALTHAPRSVGALNSMAVLHRMAGDATAAEALFLHALDVHPADANLLGNLRNLLRAQGRTLEADAIERTLLAQPSRDPYRFIEFGVEAQRDGRLHRALEFYGRASELAPYLHEAYWRMAVVHHALGNLSDAEQQLQQAKERAPRVGDRRLYNAKLAALEMDYRQ